MKFSSAFHPQQTREKKYDNNSSRRRTILTSPAYLALPHTNSHVRTSSKRFLLFAGAAAGIQNGADSVIESDGSISRGFSVFLSQNRFENFLLHRVNKLL
jgi:hypothetical protein